MTTVRWAIVCLLFLTFMKDVIAQETRYEVVNEARRPVTFEDLFAMGRVGDPQISPDGKTVLYVVTAYSMEENKSNSDIYAVDLESSISTRLTVSPASDAHPRWSPDGKSIAFISSREGGSQIWLMNPNGSEQKKRTNISSGASGVEWSPSGDHLVFTSRVYPDCPDDDCNKTRDEERKASGVKAIISDKLPYRVWNYWKQGKYSHVFVIPADEGKARDITPGPFDTPPHRSGRAWRLFGFARREGAGLCSKYRGTDRDEHEQRYLDRQSGWIQSALSVEMEQGKRQPACVFS